MTLAHHTMKEECLSVVPGCLLLLLAFGYAHVRLGLLPSAVKLSFHLGLQAKDEVQFNGVYWQPPEKGKPGAEPTSDASYTFAYMRPPRPRALRIYECHVGMSSHVRGVLRIACAAATACCRAACCTADQCTGSMRTPHHELQLTASLCEVITLGWPLGCSSSFQPGRVRASMQL